ncbi:NAD(P)/FAD-dependent oxidoreductase [Streptomyces zhihengii]|uniref:NAD(P)/FAD-dependent oxidoreductase n=1 Tax=Streptomyces zhihengii TaxID=1818004 RepID=UPI003F4C163D
MSKHLPHRSRHAVVIGGGLAGTLSAAACLPHVEHVTIIERDVLPAAPAPRKGLPQARHAHMLWSGGARAMEKLVPGVTQQWLDAGAHRIPLPTGMVSYSPAGWYRRWAQESHFLIGASRDLLDWGVRARVLQHSNVTVEQAELLSLTGTPQRVTGLLARTADGTERHFAADLVVDATGRASRAPDWLRQLGAPAVREETVDAGVVYASRIYQAPAGIDQPIVINIQADPRSGTPGQVATIIPVEGQRWIVALSGTRGGEPTDDPDSYLAFARGVRHPLVGNVLAHAEPLSDIAVTRSTINRRRYWERSHTPEGFVLVGDAVAALNPVYGHGMSVAALGALALRTQLQRRPILSKGLAAAVQRAVARPTDVAWTLATGQDIHYPQSRGRRPTAIDRALGGYVHRVTDASTGSFRVARAVTHVMTLQKGISQLVRPDIVAAAVRGSALSPLTAPPLSDTERTIYLPAAEPQG